LRDLESGAQRASRRRFGAILAGAFALSLAAAPQPAAAAGTYYVSTAGSDSATGTSSKPWRTLQKAADAAAAGSTVIIRGGTYAGFVVSRPSLTFKPYAGEVITVSGDSTHTFVIRISATNHVTISGLTVQGAPARYGAGIKVDKSSSDITITGNRIRDNRSFGVLLENTSRVTVSRNRIYRNETGIQVSWISNGVKITSNRIFDNNRMIVNDATAYNDRGANGIVFYHASGPVSVTGNRISGHRALSHDYGYDGGGLEIYASKNLRFAYNAFWDNNNVLETGTDGAACSNITFIRNIAYGGANRTHSAEGLILRCASSSLIANNTFFDLDDFVYYVTQGGAFAGSIGSLRILNNIAAQPDTKIYSLQGALPSTLVIDYNLTYNASGGSIAWVSAFGNTPLLSVFGSWTGYDRHGRQGDPRILDGQMHIAGTSPAIDHGTAISGVTGSVLGAAPDIGRWETQ